MIRTIIRKLRLFPDSEPRPLSETLRPDEQYRTRSLAQLPPSRREKRESLRAELMGVGRG